MGVMLNLSTDTGVSLNGCLLSTSTSSGIAPVVVVAEPEADQLTCHIRGDRSPS